MEMYLLKKTALEGQDHIDLETLTDPVSVDYPT